MYDIGRFGDTYTTCISKLSMCFKNKFDEFTEDKKCESISGCNNKGKYLTIFEPPYNGYDIYFLCEKCCETINGQMFNNADEITTPRFITYNRQLKELMRDFNFSLYENTSYQIKIPLIIGNDDTLENLIIELFNEQITNDMENDVEYINEETGITSGNLTDSFITEHNLHLTPLYIIYELLKLVNSITIFNNIELHILQNIDENIINKLITTFITSADIQINKNDWINIFLIFIYLFNNEKIF